MYKPFEVLMLAIVTLLGVLVFALVMHDVQYGRHSPIICKFSIGDRCRSYERPIQ